MFISAIPNSNTNFGTCIPVSKVFAKCKDGSITMVPEDKIAGITTALVKRLRNTDSKEAVFFRENINGFARELEFSNGLLTHKVASSTVGPADKMIRAQGEKAHVIFGDDINYLRNWFRQYKVGEIDKENWVWRIINQIIKPTSNRGKSISTRGKIHLALYADKKGQKYCLNGLSITDENGKIIKTLAAEAPKKKVSTKKVETGKKTDILDEESAAYSQYLEDKKIAAKELEYERRLASQEPDLLSDDPFYDN